MSALQSVELLVPPEHPPAELAQALEQVLRLTAGEPAPPLLLDYYDSFDWRLYRNGYELALERRDGTLKAVVGKTDGSRLVLFPAAAAPRFARDLPPGAHFAGLAEALDVRALLLRVELRCERREWALRDEQGSALLDFALEGFTVDPAGIAAPLTPRLRVATRGKGSRKPFRQVLERLRRDYGLEPAATSPLSEALTVLDLRPEDPSALPRAPLDPELRADAAAKQVLRNLLETLRVNEAGVRDQVDTEFLHDFRVAVRRTRSALAQIKKVFPDRITRRFARRFAKLAEMTSDARDLDVYLLDFDHHRAELPEALRGGLAPLQELLLRRCAKAHARLNAYLDSAAHRKHLRDWESFLETPPPRQPHAAKARVPIGELAGRRIWKLFRRVVREGRAITPESPAEQLHTLRKTAKKLRYLMELFRGLYPAEKIGPLVKILKALQDHLGEYQDAQVQIAHLLDFSTELRRKRAPLETLLALGALMDRLYTREQSLRESFDACFAAFAEDAHRRKFRHLFRPDDAARGEPAAAEQHTG